MPRPPAEFPRLEARKHPARAFSQVTGRIGEVTAVGERSLFINAQGGQIEVFTLRLEDGKKLQGPELCKQAGLGPGIILGADA
ncbi:MAG TPA: hypothetical protein VK437_15655 [Steroidobacteraceae bacterium]|nr:hypothetical protein [Steroidobacteraceae bacterium]